MTRHKTITDEELLGRVRNVLLDQGLTVSTKKIASGAGVSEALLFQRFGTKAALVFHALDIEHMALPDFAGLLQPGADTRADLEALLLVVWQYLREVVPCQNLAMSHPDFDIEDWKRRHDRAPVTQIPKILEAFLRSAHRRGLLNAPDPRGTADLLVAFLHSRVTFEALGVRGNDVPEKSALERPLQCLWQGLEPRKSR